MASFLHTVYVSVANCWTGFCGQESLRRNEVAIIVNKRVQNAVRGCNLKMTEGSLFISKANH